MRYKEWFGLSERRKDLDYGAQTAHLQVQVAQQEGQPRPQGQSRQRHRLGQEALNEGTSTVSLEAKLHQALARRRGLGLPGSSTTAFRLLNGEGDGLPGIAADVLGDYVVLYVESEALLALGRRLGERILQAPAAHGIVLKVRAGGRPRPGKPRQEVLGRQPERQVRVEENDIPYEVHPLGGLNVGLFTDMREHRRALSRRVGQRRVLNLFAYTGGFSVVAAQGGASAVTSVDLSPGVLRWARTNFRLSDLDPDAPRFRFEAADAARFARQELARGEEYDLVIVDPPAVSTARPSSWSMKNDYADLIATVARLLPSSGGLLWLSSHVRGDRALERHIRSGMERAGRAFRVLEAGGLPPDYPTPPGSARARYLEVAQLMVE